MQIVMEVVHRMPPYLCVICTPLILSPTPIWKKNEGLQWGTLSLQPSFFWMQWVISGWTPPTSPWCTLLSWPHSQPWASNTPPSFWSPSPTLSTPPSIHHFANSDAPIAAWPQPVFAGRCVSFVLNALFDLFFYFTGISRIFGNQGRARRYGASGM